MALPLAEKNALTGMNIPMLLALFLLAFVFRFFGLGAVSVPTGDEGVHIANAYNYVERGYFGPDMWYHPPLKHVLHYASLRAFGNNPYGWRMPNVLLGAGVVVLVWLLAMESLPGKIWGYMSAILIMLDPLHISFSRQSFEEIPASFFMVAVVYFTLRGLRTRGEATWILAGMAAGCAMASKWYAAPVILVLLIHALVVEIGRSGWRGASRPVSYLVILPLAVYGLWFIPWFQAGHSLGEWISLQVDAFRGMQHVAMERYTPGQQRFLSAIDHPLEWFTRFRRVGFSIGGGEGRSAYFLMMTNLPVWLFILPSTLYLIVLGVRERKPHALILSALFWVSFLPLLMANRPVFMYSSLHLLPFGFLCAGYASERILKQWSLALIAVAVVWCLALYPLVVGIPVREDLYGTILSRAVLMR